MYRRRRRVREIAFSFDSFLDVVANIVGIIIRLILVVWVGARSYTGLQYQPTPEKIDTATVELKEPDDPLRPELARERHELANLQARLLQQLRQFEQMKQEHTGLSEELALVTGQQGQLEQAAAALGQATAREAQAGRVVALTVAELRQRYQHLLQEIQALERLPPARKTLHYRTPVSRTLQTEELMFECRHGRVTFLDMAALKEESRRRIEDRRREYLDRLKNQWQIEDTAGPVGAFRLKFTLERERGMLDGLAGAGPATGSEFNAGLSQAIVEPVVEPRGEPLEAALAPRSEFRQIADVIDPQMTAVTMWVYADSFDLFRQLRDYLYDRDVTVAGRPLPDGVPIGMSATGKRSRGQ